MTSVNVRYMVNDGEAAVAFNAECGTLAETYWTELQ
jgi:hypothetical protein